MQSILQEYMSTLKGKRVAVIGMGVSNTPLIERLLQSGVQVLACDKRDRSSFNGLIEALERKGLECAIALRAIAAGMAV